MTSASTAHAKKRAGKVNFVGGAAKLTAKTGTLITQVATNKAKLLPSKKMITASVHGNANPICPK